MIMLGKMEIVCRGKDEIGQKRGEREERPQKRQAGAGDLGGGGCFLRVPLLWPSSEAGLWGGGMRKTGEEA